MSHSTPYDKLAAALCSPTDHGLTSAGLLDGIGGSASTEVGSVEDIGKLVREARRKMGMTQQRFADMAGVGRRFLIELERGKASLEIGRVLAVCRAAGLKITLAS